MPRGHSVFIRGPFHQRRRTPPFQMSDVRSYAHTRPRQPAAVPVAACPRLRNRAPVRPSHALPSDPSPIPAQRPSGTTARSSTSAGERWGIPRPDIYAEHCEKPISSGSGRSHERSSPYIAKPASCTLCMQAVACCSVRTVHP